MYQGTTGEHVTTLDTVAANVAKLTYKMNGDNMLDMKVNMKMMKDVQGTSVASGDDDNTQIVNGIGSISDDGVIRVFVFNHNSDYLSTQTANVSIKVCDIEATRANSDSNSDNKCNVTTWMIDDNNAQFWNIYWDDVTKLNITSFCPSGWSNQGETICITNQTEHDYIQSRTPIYQNASKLTPTVTQIDYKANECVEILSGLMPTHGVRLFEIQC